MTETVKKVLDNLENVKECWNSKPANESDKNDPLKNRLNGVFIGYRDAYLAIKPLIEKVVTELDENKTESLAV